MKPLQDDNNKKDPKEGFMPFNELELHYLTTTPAWGREVAPELENELLREIKEQSKINEETGELEVPVKALWGLLSYYTRDLRLGNLGGNQFLYCQEWLDFAGACLRRGYKESFMASLTRVISVVELSQSKDGFLRKRQGTITREDIFNPQKENAKRKLYGGKKE